MAIRSRRSNRSAGRDSIRPGQAGGHWRCALGLAILLMAGCGRPPAPNAESAGVATTGKSAASVQRATAPIHAGVVDVVAGDVAAPVTLAPGQLLRVHLLESPATGYRWSLQSQVPASLRLEADPGADPVRANVRTWSFRVLRPDLTHLRFAYRRSWETVDDAGESISFDLHIH